MKSTVIWFVSLFLLLFSLACYASFCGSGCSSGSGYPSTSGCGSGGCVPRAACGSRCIYDTPCQCTDPGVNYNTCMDRCTYCEAFGNIGAR